MLSYSDPETGLEIDSCPECFGLWFDGEELSRLFCSRTLAERILEEDALPDVVSPARKEGQERSCPSCREPMRPSTMGDVTLDYCLRCRGIWMDHGELLRVVELYRKGEAGNLLILNQLAEGLRAEARRENFVKAAVWMLSD